MPASFLPVIRDAMRPLAEAFHLRDMAESESNTDSEVCYENDTTRVRVVLDWMDFRPLVWLSRRSDRTGPPDEDRGPAEEYDANGLFVVRRVPDSTIEDQLGRRDAEEARRLLSRYATLLERHAADVLRGDFAVFPELARRVAARRGAWARGTE
jgi:hypothetical protein